MINLDALERNDNLQLTKSVGDGSECLTDMYFITSERFPHSKVGGISTLMLCALSDGVEYKSYAIPTFVRFKPTKMFVKEYNGLKYLIYFFEKGSSFINRKVVVNGSAVKFLCKEFLIMVKIPFFFTNADVVEVFQNFKKYSNNKIGDNIVVVSLLLSIVTRNQDDVLWRNRKPGDTLKRVSLSNIGVSRDDTFSRITTTGLKSGLLASSYSEDIVTPIEKLFD